MIHAEYQHIFETLRNADISFCQLRDDIESGELVDDLDLLVHPDHFDRAILTLESIGYRIKVTRKYLQDKTVLVKWLKRDFVVIDLHRSLVQNGFKILDGDQVLSRAKSRGATFMPAGSDLLLVLLFHNIVGKGDFQKKHQSQVRDLIEKLDRDAVQYALGSNKLFRIIAPVIDDPNTYFLDRTAAYRLRKQIVVHCWKTDPMLFPRLVRRRVMAIWRRYGPRPRAPLFALMGVDGAGKSSLTEALLEQLNQPRGFPTTTIYMGPWGHYKLRCMGGELFVPGWSVDTKSWLTTVIKCRNSSGVSIFRSAQMLLKTIFGRSMTAEEKALYELLRTQSRVFVTLRYVRSLAASARFFVLLILEMYYRYFLVYRKRQRGITVIADRYIYDLMTGRMHQIITNYRKTRAALCRLFPRPTRAFLLTNDPDTILGRKADLTEAALKDFINLYDQLAQQFDFKEIRTEKDPQELAEQIISENFDTIVSSVRT